MKCISVYFLLFIIFTLLLGGCKIFEPSRSNGRPESLAKFFEKNGYNLIYPLDSVPEPGAIYEETDENGLGKPLAYKDTCAKDLKTRSGEISFGEYIASSEFGINFFIGLSTKKVEAGLKGAFEKEVSYTVSSEPMPTLECDKVTLERALWSEGTMKGDCRRVLLQDNAVVLSKVASVKKFTFKFNGLKRGGINIIIKSLTGAELNVEKINKETIVLKYDKPRKLCYQRFTPRELGIVAKYASTEFPDVQKEANILQEGELNSFTKEFFEASPGGKGMSDKKDNVDITSFNQSGGVTAQKVTINNYFQSPPFLEKKESLKAKLKQIYNFGYAIFGVDGRNTFMPYDINFTEQFDIEWGVTKVKHLTDRDISILFPKIIYKPLNSTIDRLTITIPRQVGYQRKFPIQFAHQKFIPFIEVLEDHKDFVVLVIGFR